MCYSAMVERDLELLSAEFEADQNSLFPTKIPEGKKNPDKTNRIFPDYICPIVASHKNSKRYLQYMSYSLPIPQFIEQQKKYTSYNTRLDNIDSRFWSASFCTHHGIIVVKKFFEWVAVRDLLENQRSNLATVESIFAQQIETRKCKVEAQGKKFRLTATEKKSAINRYIIVSFSPSRQRWLYVPVLFDFDHKTGFPGFSIITHEPPEEIEEAGHDRCPLFLDKQSSLHWLQTETYNSKDFKSILRKQQPAEWFHLKVEGG